jgi:hypothetical protein
MMLASIAETHADFAALSRYLIHGKRDEEVSPQRVDWIEGHNLATADPELAAKIMAATARLSARVEKPVYHASIAWHPDEAPAPAEMKDIARRALELMGLEEHQSLVVGHGDTAHRHLHLMVNRVHPESGKAWRTSHDYLRFDRVMKLLAEDHGFVYAPAKRFKPGDENLVDPARSRSTRMSREDSRKLGKTLQENVEEAQSWEDVEIAAALEGYRLETKGQGIAVVGGREYARFSDLGTFARMKELERRFSEPFSNYRKQPLQLVDGIDIVKALVGMGMAERKDIARAVQDCVRTQEEQSRPNLRREVAKAIKQALAPQPTRRSQSFEGR